MSLSRFSRLRKSMQHCHGLLCRAVSIHHRPRAGRPDFAGEYGDLHLLHCDWGYHGWRVDDDALRRKVCYGAKSNCEYHCHHYPATQAAEEDGRTLTWRQPTTATATSTAQPLSSSSPAYACPGVNGTIVQDQNSIPYEVRCGYDVNGVSIGGGVPVSNGFNDCFYQCDANSQCVAWAFSGGYCYLKVCFAEHEVTWVW